MEQPIERYIETARQMIPPRREVTTRHRCLCVLLRDYRIQAADGEVITQQRDACTGWSEIPDSPLCAACIASGHDSLPHVSYVEVQASREVIP